MSEHIIAKFQIGPETFEVMQMLSQLIETDIRQQLIAQGVPHANHMMVANVVANVYENYAKSIKVDVKDNLAPPP